MAETGEKPIKVLDLFSGIGGFSLGLEQAGMKTIAFCEVDKKATRVLNKHWPTVPVFDDVKTLKGIHVGSVDLICGGFPCQDISIAGKGAGLAGERSGLWWEFHRLVKEIRPSWVIAENVSALRHRGLGQVLGSLAEIGYDAEWHCIPASAVGAPHRRDRIWIVAYPNGDRQRARNEPKQSSRYSAGKCLSDSSGLGATGVVADTNESRLEGRIRRSLQECQSKQPLGEGSTCSRELSDFWLIEPSVGRVAHGIPGRVDRLKQLGNAVVPQIPMLIGKAIQEWEKSNGNNR